MRQAFLRALGWCALLVLLVPGCQSQRARPEGPGFLWKVTSDTNTVYLLGSIHAGKEEFYPLPADVEDTFARSATLVVEIDQSRLDPAAAKRWLNALGTYPPGQSLRGSVSKETADLLKTYCSERGLTVGSLDRFRPWAVILAVTVQELHASGYSEQFGIDVHFVNQARKANKPIIELEAAETQIKLFSNLTAEEQEQLLVSTLAELPKMKAIMENTWSAWYAGDARRIDEELLAPSRNNPGSKRFYEKVFDDRNVEMALRIETFLNDREPYFVVVGAGHLVGEKGLIRLLEDRKYKVEQIHRGTLQKKAG